MDRRVTLMNNWTSHISKGTLSVTVAVMLAVALIAAQVKGAQSDEAAAEHGMPAQFDLRIHSSALDAPLIEALLPLAIEVTITPDIERRGSRVP